MDDSKDALSGDIYAAYLAGTEHQKSLIVFDLLMERERVFTHLVAQQEKLDTAVAEARIDRYIAAGIAIVAFSLVLLYNFVN